jgi:CheY-like chemotaxis protein
MKSILLVDDNEFLLSALVAWLKSTMPDYRILIGFNGRDGVEILKQNSVDVIMTDLRMPVMDGFTFIEQKNRLCPDTPVIVMTSDYSDEVMNRLKALGVSRCIEKPFAFNTVSSELQEVMLDHQNSREVATASS